MWFKKILQKWLSDDVQAAKTVAENYRQLILKAATVEDISPADETALRIAAEKLGKDGEAVAMDIAAMQEYTQVQAVASQKADAHKALRASIEEQRVYLAETIAIQKARAVKTSELEKARGGAGVAYMSVCAAESRMHDLERKHWALLGHDDPAAKPAKVAKTPAEVARECREVEEDNARLASIAASNAKRIADAAAAARRRAGEAVTPNPEVTEDPAAHAKRVAAENAKRAADAEAAVRWSTDQNESSPHRRAGIAVGS
jgi:hypothetical protein